MSWMLRIRCLLYGFFLLIPGVQASQGLSVQKGELDLSGHDWTRDQDVSLEGEWRFIPYAFVDEEEIRSGAWEKRGSTFVSLPGALIDAKPIDGNPFDEKTWGTLVLKVNGLKETHRELAIRLRGDTAFSIHWLDMSLSQKWSSVLSVGQVGSNKDSSIPQIADRVGRILVDGSGPYYLVIHLSGYHYIRSSLWTVPRLGLYSALSREVEVQLMTEVFVCGMILIMSIYYLSLYLHRREDKAALWLAYFTGVNFLRLLGSSGLIGSRMFSEPSWMVYELSRKLLMSATGLIFLTKTWNYPRLERLFKWNIGPSLLWVLFCVFTTAETYPHFIIPVNIYALICTVLSLGIGIHAFFKGYKGGGAIMVGIIILMLCIVTDMSIGLGIIASPIFLSPFGLTALIFSQGQVLSKLFASAFRTAERLSLHLKDEVDRQTIEIRSMLDHIPQGVLNLVPPGVVDASFSKHLHKILEGQDIAGKTLEELLWSRSTLSADAKDRIHMALFASLGDDVLNFDTNAGQLPGEVTINLPGGAKILQVTWSPIADRDDRVMKILITLHDITQIRRFEEETLAQRQELEYIQEIIAVPADRFAGFLDSSHRFMEENRRLIQANKGKNLEALKILFVNMHTIKGAARTLGFHLMTGILHEVEQYYAQLLRQEEEPWSQERLQSDVERAEHILDRYEHINNEVLGRGSKSQSSILVEREVMEEQAQLLKKLILHIDNDALHGTVQEAQRRLEELVFSNTADTFQDILSGSAKIARDLGKEPPKIIVGGAPYQISFIAQRLLRNIFTHIIRNSIDHGLEESQERIARGKPTHGTIRVDLEDQDGFLIINYQDDGRGLALEKLRHKSRQLGLLPDPDTALPQELGELIFKAGLSTADAISELSGRGVGMDAVRRYVEDVGGTVELILRLEELKDGYCPFSLVIRLPDSLYLHQNPSRKNKGAA